MGTLDLDERCPLTGGDECVHEEDPNDISLQQRLAIILAVGTSATLFFAHSSHTYV